MVIYFVLFYEMLLINNKSNLFNIIDRFLNLSIILILNKKKILNFIYILKYIYIYFNIYILIINSIKKKNKKYIKTIISGITINNTNNIKLKLKGVEYKILNKNNYLIFYLGYSHLIVLKINDYFIFKNNKLIELNYKKIFNNYIKNIRFQLIKLKILNKYKKKGFLYEK